LVHLQFIAVAQHPLTQRSEGQRSKPHGYDKNHHGRTVASDHGPDFSYLYATVLPVAVAYVF